MYTYVDISVYVFVYAHLYENIWNQRYENTHTHINK